MEDKLFNQLIESVQDMKETMNRKPNLVEPETHYEVRILFGWYGQRGWQTERKVFPFGQDEKSARAFLRRVNRMHHHELGHRWCYEHYGFDGIERVQGLYKVESYHSEQKLD